MKFYVGVTNDDWFFYLSERKPDEVNFWRPRSQNDFRALAFGEPFLFKLHHPRNYIVGGGFFVRHTFLPIELMWKAFDQKNGASDLATLRGNILKHRNTDELGKQIGCTILCQPFFFERDDWISIPPDWSSNIVSGKTYDSQQGPGIDLWKEVESRLSANKYESDSLNFGEQLKPRYGPEQVIRPRLGQGAFRILVTDAYERKCSITGERTLPVLEAAHIRPYSEQGPHSINNGLLMRSDWHQLFDAGYVSITPNRTIVVSKLIREEFSNGREYYAFDGQELKSTPLSREDQPASDFLDWHYGVKYRR